MVCVCIRVCVCVSTSLSHLVKCVLMAVLRRFWSLENLPDAMQSRSSSMEAHTQTSLRGGIHTITHTHTHYTLSDTQTTHSQTHTPHTHTYRSVFCMSVSLFLRRPLLLSSFGVGGRTRRRNRAL